MNDNIFELLSCIKECPDAFVSKNVIFNILKTWSYGKLDYLIQELKDNNLVNIHNFDNIEQYSISEKGDDYIKNFQSNKVKERNEKLFDKFSGCIYPTILFLISTVLTLILYFLNN